MVSVSLVTLAMFCMGHRSACATKGYHQETTLLQLCQSLLSGCTPMNEELGHRSWGGSTVHPGNLLVPFGIATMYSTPCAYWLPLPAARVANFASCTLCPPP